MIMFFSDVETRCLEVSNLAEFSKMIIFPTVIMLMCMYLFMCLEVYTYKMLLITNITNQTIF